MQLDRLENFPADIARITLSEIKQVFPNPTLISIPGAKREPLLVSTLLHGNEATSFEVLQHLQSKYTLEPPPRSLLIFIGNVEAASLGVRLIEGLPDFNRIWAHGSSEHHALAQDILKIAREQEVFASIDIHNNTGANPIYGCVNALRPADLQLAAMFAPVGVFYLNPNTTQSIAFSQLCPAITIECGKNGNVDGAAAAIRLVEDVLRQDTFSSHPPRTDALELYETVGRVIVAPECSISFDSVSADLVFRPDLENMNFTEMKACSRWATTASQSLPLYVLDENEKDITSDFFQLDRGIITLTRDVTPAMITPDVLVIRQDCLCYLMTHI